MGPQAGDFLRASGRFQTAFYKAEIEEALRTPGMGGFQLLGLHDFPGQGTAPVGVLDAFWEEKGYVRPEEYRRFCAETVLLARLARRVYTSDETLRATVEVAHFGPRDLAPAPLAVARSRRPRVRRSRRAASRRARCPRGRSRPWARSRSRSRGSRTPRG